MAAIAAHPDVEKVGAGHRLAGEDVHLYGREMRGVVQAVDLVAGEALEQLVGEHGAGAAQALLGGLEDEDGGAGEIAVLREIAGRAQQHGGVAVMAAAMKAAGVL